MSADMPSQKHPSSPGAKSETSRASSDLSSLPRPFPSFPLPPRAQDPVPALPVSRNIRNLVIDDNTTDLTTAALPPGPSIKRKPLSAAASPIATRYSSGAYLTIAKARPRPEQKYSRSCSLDSPTVYEFPRAPVQHTPLPPLPDLPSQTKPADSDSDSNSDSDADPDSDSDSDVGPDEVTTTAQDDKDLFDDLTREYPEHQDQDQDQRQHEHELEQQHVLATAESDPAAITGEVVDYPDSQEHNPAGLQTSTNAELSDQDEHTSYDDLLADDDEDPLSDNILDGYNSDSSYSSNHNSNTMSLHLTRKATPPHLTLRSDNAALTPANNELKTPNTDKPLPKSPGSSKLSNFFGWTASSPSNSEVSEKGFSPLPSPAPLDYSKSTSITDASPVTAVGPQSLLEAPKVQYGAKDSREYCESYLATPPVPSSAAAQIEEMEDELKAISAELASSIRREMDLEDLVEKLQAERDNPTTNGNKRTSDYFSDSGYSTAKYSDYDQSKEEIEKIQRRAEQERAQVRLELTTKLQDERSKRQELDEQIRQLSEKASQFDIERVNSADASGRIKELENTCETLRRKLSEERQVKDNFEDLLSALKGELQNASNERDNLRDEVIPQLRARVEGLEGQAAELEKMNYESTKLQQELQSLKTENTSLRRQSRASMDSIAEEGMFAGAAAAAARLSRSNSLTGPPSSLRVQRPPSSGLTRSKTVKSSESRDQLSERLKDVEEQRDALHRALKNLLERQEYQNRENEKKIRALEMERDRLMTTSPQKAGFQREVSNLRAEINTLRRRAEEAMDQKWQVEKGLSGLKMDLDRAEQEITSLRSLLGENDILIPPSLARSSTGSDKLAVPVTSDSLAAAYEDLQKAYTESLERIKKLEDSASQDEKTQFAVEKLEQALSSAVFDRDLARQEAATYKDQLDALKAREQTYLESEKALADELSESARRVEELAIQVRQQLATNQTLRQRISETVSRGEANQKASSQQITTMQARLRALEEKLEAAQAATEDRIARHEDEMYALKESHNAQLKRMGNDLRSPRMFPSKSPLSPLFAASGARTPRITSTRSGPAISVTEETQVDNLRARVAELENALSDADSEMQEVVGRMNMAQIEVLELQEEREAAISQTRRLERELQAEKVKAFEGRFKSLQS
ncbi:hypothetical protein F4775DRAFT_576914 [Biscogniauxia sp. FL1348]|nr:hypothetical protein F4775DRAFT_576914 [Biscogniauxia sp. FL1348]